MATVPIRQESFAAGELSQRLHGRTALAKYAVGLRRAHNFFIAPEGAALNRPGTLQVREAKDSAAGVDRGVVYVPFVFSEDLGQSYVLEFGHQYVRFHVGGATVATGNPAIPYEVATPYAAADLWRLQYAQQGDVLRLTCRGYAPQELRRLAHANWAIGPLLFDLPKPNGTVYLHISALDLAEDGTHPKKQWSHRITEIWERQTGVQWETAPVGVDYVAAEEFDPWSSRFTYPLGAKVTHGGGYWRSLQANNLNHAPAAGAWWTADDVGTIPSPVYINPVPTELVLFPDRVVKLWTPADWGLTVNDGSRLLARRVYRGRGDDFGYIGEWRGLEFSDPGDVPQVSRTPPQGRDPFKVYNSAGQLLRTEQPAAVTYHRERPVLAGTVERPATLFLGRVGDYYNFDRHSPAAADDAFEPELASQRREEVRWVLGGDTLLIGTQSSIWALVPPQGTVLGPGAAESRLQGTAGSSWLAPLQVPPDVVIYSRTKGNGVRDLVYDSSRERFIGSDLALLARHLFTERRIVSWAYAEDPWSVIWAVRDDGVLLSLTYVRDQEVWAWAWHDTQGLVEQVCTIPEGSEDAVYLLVRRQKGDGTWHRYVERMASRIVPVGSVDGREMLFLDSAVTVRHLAAGAPVTGLGHLEGLSVVALADGNVVRTTAAGAPLVVAGGQVVLPDPEGQGFGIVHVGLPYVAELELLDLVVGSPSGGQVKNQVKSVSRVAIELEDSRGLEVAECLADRRGVPTPDEDWTTWEQREVEDGWDPVALFSGEVELSTFSSWNRHGRAAVRQREPLPCTILAVTREADLGGR